MALGGKRPGAGRKPGSRNRTRGFEVDPAIEVARVKEFANTVELTLDQVCGMTEIDVMRHAMLLYAMKQQWPQAASVAKEIAPYRFAKLTSAKIEAHVTRSLEDLSDDELASIAGDIDGESEGEGSSGITGEDNGEE